MKTQREIKFRVWEVPGVLLSSDRGSIDFKGAIHEIGDDWQLFSYIMRHLEEYIVMQYTGLKDKNGKEIYEGDVVQWEYQKYQPKQDVRFAEGSFGIPTTVGHVPLTEYLHQEMEIIGNIYENSELLK